MSEKLVTVGAYSMPWQADIARATLEAEDIPAFLADANMVSMNWLYSNAIGGIRVEVPEEFAEQAIKVLSSQSESIDDLPAEEEDAIICPKCGKKNVTIVREGRRWAFLSWLLVGFPMFYPPKKYQCVDCSKTWKCN